MELTYKYRQIKKIAQEVKKVHKINSLVEVVQYVFSDDDVFNIFVREGAGLKSNSAAEEFIEQAMENGEDYFAIQQEVVRGLIKANFYVKELTEILNNLTVSTEVVA